MSYSPYLIPNLSLLRTMPALRRSTRSLSDKIAGNIASTESLAAKKETAESIPITSSKRGRKPATKKVIPTNKVKEDAGLKVGREFKIEDTQATSPRNAITPPPRSRKAGPHVTNAQLVSPDTSRPVLAYKPDESPSKQPGPRPTTSTEKLLEEACHHLCAVDPKLQTVVEKHHCHLFSPEGLAEVVDPFQALCSSIIGQQVCSTYF
jgi:DNA-3-methyladenine glycosylase II